MSEQPAYISDIKLLREAKLRHIRDFKQQSRHQLHPTSRRQEYDVTREWLVDMLLVDCSVKEMANVMGVCEGTIYYNLKKFGLGKKDVKYTNLTNEELDEEVSEIIIENSKAGFGIATRKLHAKNVRVKKRRLIASLRRVRWKLIQKDNLPRSDLLSADVTNDACQYSTNDADNNAEKEFDLFDNDPINNLFHSGPINTGEANLFHSGLSYPEEVDLFSSGLSNPEENYLFPSGPRYSESVDLFSSEPSNTNMTFTPLSLTPFNNQDMCQSNPNFTWNDNTTPEEENSFWNVPNSPDYLSLFVSPPRLTHLSPNAYNIII